MRTLVTGAGGMVGSHMVEILHRRGHETIGTHYKPTTDITEIDDAIPMIEMDIRYPQSVESIITEFKPSAIFHLAAQSYPTVSWERPYETLDTNANGTIAIFEAVKKARKTDASYDPTVVVACSSAEYGQSFDDTPDGLISEDAPLLPLHPYGVSKVAQDLLAFQYCRNDQIRSIRARIFNTTGTRKTNDVTSDLTKRAVTQEKLGAEHPIMRVGNVNTERAILDVRDLIDALILLAKTGEPGEAYNISATKTTSINELIQLIQSITGLEFELQVDPSLLRTTDEKRIIGDTTKLRKATGWEPKIPYADTVAEMLDYWRAKLPDARQAEHRH